MKSKLMSVAAAAALLVSFACGCAMETGSEEETSADPKTGSADEKTGTTESAQDIFYPDTAGTFYGRTYFAGIGYPAPGYFDGLGWLPGW
jgi:hypothetical protein